MNPTCCALNVEPNIITGVGVEKEGACWGGSKEGAGVGVGEKEGAGGGGRMGGAVSRLSLRLGVFCLVSCGCTAA